MRKEITDKMLLNDLKKLSKYLGRTPGVNDIIYMGSFSHSTYFSRFGSLKKAQKLAGLKPNNRGCQRIYTKEIMLKRLREIKKYYSVNPSYSEIIGITGIDKSSFDNAFGTMKKALLQAGLKINKQPKQFKK